jgi:hypothetical protein
VLGGKMPKHLLLIDDEPTILMAFKKLLQNWISVDTLSIEYAKTY